MDEDEPMDEDDVVYCPFCGRPLVDQRVVAPAPLRRELAQDLAPLRAVGLTWMFVLTVVLLSTAAGAVVYHRTVGSIIAAAVCLILTVAIWYGRLHRRDAGAGH